MLSSLSKIRTTYDNYFKLGFLTIYTDILKFSRIAEFGKTFPWISLKNRENYFASIYEINHCKPTSLTTGLEGFLVCGLLSIVVDVTGALVEDDSDGFSVDGVDSLGAEDTFFSWDVLIAGVDSFSWGKKGWIKCKNEILKKLGEIKLFKEIL